MRSVSTLKGVVLSVLSAFAFCGMSVLIKKAEGIDSFKTALFRFVIGGALLGTAALAGRIRLEFVHGPLLFLRGLFGGFAVYLFFLSISKLGVAQGTVLSYAYPVFAAVFSAIFLKERIGLMKGLALAAALAGIYVMTASRGPTLGLIGAFGLYEMLAILGAVLSALAVVIVKQLHQTDSTYAIFYSQCVMGVWVVVIPANLVPCEIGVGGGVILLGIGIMATVAQLLMTEGYRHVSVTVGSVLGMLVPVLNFGVGVLFFKEEISRAGAAGAGLVIAACFVVSMAGPGRKAVAAGTAA